MKQTFSESQEKLILLLLASIQFAHTMDFMVMMPLGPQLMRLFNLSPAEFGHIVSAYGISSGIAGFILAPFIDRYDRKQFLRFCMIGLFAGTLLCGLAPTASILLLARCIAGFFGGALGGLVQAVISDVFPPQRRGYAISRVMIAFSISSILGLPVGLALANRFGWHMPFFIVSAMLLILFFAALIRFPRMVSHIDNKVTTKERVMQLSHLFVERQAIVGFMMTFFIIAGQFMVITYISPFIVKNLSFSESYLPLMYFLGGAASIITMPLIGKATDAHGTSKIFPAGVLISIFPLFVLTHLTTTNIYVILSVTTLFMICMGARMVPYSSLLTTVVEPQKRGAYLSMNSSVQSLAQGGAALLGGVLISENAAGQLEGYGLSGWIAAVFSLITIGLGYQIAKAGASSAQQTSSMLPSQQQPTSESADPT
jgi:predicted MFS family arabinose efflux permease